ncbi:hypothetical protein DVH24_042473 [Malus domestica]|uniref:Uncharacterized protein n=1 Tax=Malus domestica TaxID=3750 RepID=A0A498KYW4_MALDO|nr:hypothetical protein DVH24_042473 [Malus domestica]
MHEDNQFGRCGRLYYGFLTTFSIGPLISSFSELGLWKKEKKEPRRKYQQQPVLLRTAHDVHIDLLCASASSIG